MQIQFVSKKIKRLIRPILEMQKQSQKLVNCGLKCPIDKRDLDIYRDLSLTPIAMKLINLDDLKYAICLDFEKVLKPFFEKGDGQIDRSITNSPHFKLIEYYKSRGFRVLKKNFRELDYYKFMMSFNKVGYKMNYFNPAEKITVHYTDESIWKKISIFIRLFENIKQNGYLCDLYRGNYISALEIPLVVSRFGWKVDYKPFELFRGHHRAACLAALGFDAVDVLVLKDIKGLSK